MNRRIGYRFHPTDEELVDYFLRHKLNRAYFDDDVRDIDICSFEPWDLPKYAAQGSDDQVWYFFYRRERINKSPARPRYNRSTKTGHWKPTGAERPVRAKRTRKEIGVKRTLVFYKHGEPKELRTNWVIHEYETKLFPNQQAELVLCKLKEKVDAKADSSACRLAESSHSGASDFQTYREEIPFPISQFDRQLILETVFPGRITFEQPCESQSQIEIDEAFSALQQHIQIDENFSAVEPQIELEEGVSIDDLMWDDDIFQNGSNGLTDQFDITELLQNSNEMDDSFFNVPGDVKYINVLTRITDPSDLEETASNAYTHRSHSSSRQSFGGFYFEELCDMDSNEVYTESCESGDPSSNYGEASSKEYRQTRRIQAITETLPLPIYQQSRTVKNHVNSDDILVTEALLSDSDTDRDEKINLIGIASKDRDKILVMEALSSDSDTDRDEKINFVGIARKEFPSTVKAGEHRGICYRQSKARNQIQVKSMSGTSKSKAKEATKCGTETKLSRQSPKETIVVKTERDPKVVTAKTDLKPRTERVTGNNKNCSFIQLEKRSLPKSVCIFNVIIGIVLFMAAGWYLLILH